MRKIFAGFCFCFVSLTAIAQTGLWEDVKESSVAANNAVPELAPDKGRVLRLNQAMLRDLLAKVPMEFTPAAASTQVVIAIPMPDGSFQRFRVEESPMLSPAVAAQVPHWKSYSGRGIDDPTAVIRFSQSNAGFSAMVMGATGSSFIDAVTKTDRNQYVVYHRDDLENTGRSFHCGVDEYLAQSGTRAMAEAAQRSGELPTPNFSSGTNLRTYRIAIATTGEYTATFASQDAAFEDVMRSVNRINLVFRRDISVAFQLVSGKNLVFPDASTDPYDNTDSTAQLDINQTTIDNALTTGGYDIGHLYGTGGGGVAFSPSVCSSIKAKGYSARVPPTGDSFWVDYVAHEIGHQFAAQHTYNTLEGGGVCSTRKDTSAYEVASGATIMSYVGICGQRNLQRFSLDNFHVQSLSQMLAQVATGGGSTCGTVTATGNAAPTPNAGANFTIPKGTPFTLTGSATDPNTADALTYSWEQYDLAQSASGPNGSPAGTFDIDSDGVLRPLFRVYAPITSPTRTYPSLPYILNNANIPPQTFTGTSPTGAVCAPGVTCVTGETLPAVTRTLNFRLVVRDNSGGTADAAMQINVNGDSGPFAVTAPNGGATLSGAQTITWDVNNTNSAPVSASNVKITLSTDGGQTFGITLAENAPNTGSANVTLPDNISTTAARVKIEAIGNIFFDISDANFTVVAAANCHAVSEISPKAGTTGDTVTITGVNFANGGNVTAVKFSNDVTATFTVVNDTTITATVPTGAASGPITVSKTGCPDAQSPSFSFCPGAPEELKVDDGTLESRIGSGNGGVAYVNRLTPTKYPATLTQVSIFWDPFLDFAPGSPITVVAGSNPSGSDDINGVVLQSFPGTAGTQGFTTYTLPNPLTITAGDFVVGYSVQNGVSSSVAVDTNSPQNRSYFFNGSSYAKASGNYMIRASQVYAECGTTPAPSPSPTPTATPLPTATPSATPTPPPGATPTVQFDSANVSVKEDTGEAKLTITRTGDTSGTTTVNYATADGTAKAGQDYTAESGQVTFAPNETSKEITIAVSNDPSDEPAETFGVTLNPPGGEARGRSRVQPAAAESLTANVTIEDDDPTPPGLANISTRLKVEIGDNALIGGIIVTGNEPKRMIIRAIGPSAEVPGSLQNPQLQLFKDDELLVQNDNWEDAPNRQEIVDSTVAPTNSLESAILTTLQPGVYTAVVRGVNNGTGVGLVEAYDLDQFADSKFANIATRGFVQGGDNAIIGGLIVLGDSNQRVIIRAIGPSTEIVGNLADPTLELVDSNGVVVRANNNWKDAQEDEIRATTIPPKNDRESAIVETLAPAAYTAVVRGVGNTIGIAVVEVYALD